MHARFSSLSLSLSVALALGSFFILAAPLAEASYLPGQTLDPTCLPTDPTCIVTSLTASSTANSFPYYAANGSTLSATSTLTILQNGNVGIGTTSPYAPLSVVGQVVGSYFTANSSSATSTFGILQAKTIATSTLDIATINNSFGRNGFFADFTNCPNGTNLSGYRPLNYGGIGTTTFAIGNTGIPQCNNGYVSDTNSQLYYANITAPSNITSVGIEFVIGSGNTVPTIAYGANASAATQVLHANCGTNNCTVQARITGGSQDFVLTCPFKYPLQQGVPYKLKMASSGNTVAIYGPNGEFCSASDPRVGQLTGNTAFFESNDNTLQIKRFYATDGALNSTPTPFAEASDVAATSLFDQNGNPTAWPFTTQQLQLLAGGANSPQISGGPSGAYSLLASVLASVTAGNTTFQSSLPLPNGTYLFDPYTNGGANVETVTVTNKSGASSPYTITISSGFTKNHNADTYSAPVLVINTTSFTPATLTADQYQNWQTNGGFKVANCLYLTNVDPYTTEMCQNSANNLILQSATGGATSLTLTGALTAQGSGVSSFAGNVAIGTTTPYAKLTVWGSDTASTTSFLVANSASTTVFAVYNNGNATYAGSIFQSSDRGLKTNITPLEASSSLSAILGLTPVSYTRLDQPEGGTNLGFLAQDVQQIFPELVSTTSPTALTPNGTLTLNYIGLIAPIVEAIKELAGEVGNLAKSITTQVITAVTGNFTRVNTSDLCLTDSSGSTCYTRSQLNSLLNSQSSQNTNSITITDSPTCTLTASPTSVTPGDHVVLSYNFPDAGTFSIDQNIGSVSPALSGTTTSKAINADTIFTGTAVSATGATVTCAASVSVTSTPPPPLDLSTSTPPVVTPDVATSTATSTQSSGTDTTSTDTTATSTPPTTTPPQNDATSTAS